MNEAKAPETPSRAAGACVLIVAAAVAVGTLFAVSPATGVLATWTLGAWMVWRGASRGPVQRTANPAPPARPEVVVNEELQVTSLGNGAGYVVYPAGERVRVTRRRDES